MERFNTEVARPRIPCYRGPYRCRHWESLHWWSWAGLAWDDYWWVQYGQYGGD